MRIEKWQALGNDYLIVERKALPFQLTAARVRRLCEAHFGVGADGLLELAPPSDPDDVADLRIFNPDGSEAELSGNGAREAILYLRRRGWTDSETFSIHTPAGRIVPRITGPHSCRVDMGRASLRSQDFPDGPPDGLAELSAGGRTWGFRHVSIGNPQCAIALAEEAQLSALDLGAVGPPIEAHAEFPNRTNVSWYVELERSPPAQVARIRARIFERGVGETLSSGTGASGAAVAYALALREHGGHAAPPGGQAPRTAGGMAASAEGAGEAMRVLVELDGGELEVEVAADLHVHLSGWALPVFEGRLSEELTKELHEIE